MFLHMSRVAIFLAHPLELKCIRTMVQVRSYIYFRARLRCTLVSSAFAHVCAMWTKTRNARHLLFTRFVRIARLNTMPVLTCTSIPASTHNSSTCASCACLRVNITRQLTNESGCSRVVREDTSWFDLRFLRTPQSDLPAPSSPAPHGGLYKSTTLHTMIHYNGFVNSEESLQSMRCLQAPQGKVQWPGTMSTVQSSRLEMCVLGHRQAEKPGQERPYYL